MKNITSNRFFNFSKDEQDVVLAGVDYFKHWMFQNFKKDKYKEFAEGVSLEEKQRLYTDGLKKEALRRSGLNIDFSMVNEGILRTNPNFQWSAFALISETLDLIIPDTVLDDFYMLADVRNMKYGDNMIFHVESSDLFAVNKMANGIRKGERQRISAGDITLTPVKHEVTVYEELYRVLCGRSDLGKFMVRVAASIENQIAVEVYNTLFSSFSALGTPYKETGFTTDATINLVNLVQAKNRGAQTAIYGTKVGVSKILPENQYLQFQLGEQYNSLGYLPNFHGIPVYALNQKVVANSDTLAVDDNTLYVVSTGVDKPVKIGFEGDTLILPNTNIGGNADMSLEYTVQKFWDIQVITSAKYGVIKLS